MERARKHSRKRDAILDCIRRTQCHPTAEWVYNQLKPQIPDLSLGTVYRNIAMFKNEGIIQSVGVVNGLEHFDVDIEPHTHFICSRCANVFDLKSVTLPPEVFEEAQKLSSTITGYQLQFTGQCANCMTPDPKQNS